MGLPSNRRTRGASLIELMTAIFVLTFGVMGALQLYYVQMDKTRTLHEYTVAHAALTAEIETLRASSFDALALGDAQPFSSTPPAFQFLHRPRGWVDVADRSGETAGLKAITVHLEWTGEHGRTIHRTLTTMIARKD